MAFQMVVDQAGVTDYSGNAERVVFEFSTVPGASWAAQAVIDRAVAELAMQNSKLLWIKIWRDTSPIWETKYRVEMTASASPLFWGLIVLAILAVVLLVLTWRIVSEVKGIIWGPEGAGGAGIVSGVAWAVAAAAAVVVVGILLVKGRN